MSTQPDDRPHSRPDAGDAPDRDAAQGPDDTDRSERPGSELEEGLDHLGKAVGGVLTRLLGSRYTRVELDPERPVISPEADEAVDRAGRLVGRWLNATGQGLRSHPTDPLAALNHANAHLRDEVELREGEAPLAAGARSLAGGLYRSTEAVLDIVAPRRPKSPAEQAEDETGADETGADDAAEGETGDDDDRA